MWYIKRCFSLLVGISLQTGRLNISQTLQGWSCSSACSPSQHCRLPRCTNVVFPKTFSGSGTVSTSSGSGAFRGTIQHHQAVMEGLWSNNRCLSIRSNSFLIDLWIDSIFFCTSPHVKYVSCFIYVLHFHISNFKYHELGRGIKRQIRHNSQ